MILTLPTDQLLSGIYTVLIAIVNALSFALCSLLIEAWKKQFFFLVLMNMLVAWSLIFSFLVLPP